MLTKRLPALFALALMLLLLLSPAVMAADDSGAAAAGGFVIVSLICSVLAGLVVFAIYVYLIYFVYTDANARGQNAILWAILTAIPSFTLIVFIVWLIIRPAKKM